MKEKTLALAVTSILFSTLAQAGSSTFGHTGAIEFEEVLVPTMDAEMRSIQASSEVKINGRSYPIGYKTIMRSGDQPGRGHSGGVFGQLYNIEGTMLFTDDGWPRIANDNDFSSLIIGDDGDLYMVSHFESRPAAMYLTELRQDKKTGELTAKRTRALDFTDVKGGWVHCAGSVTPWGNHLGSEEYEPDAKLWLGDSPIPDYEAAMAAYFPESASYPSLNEAALDVMNPYHYGFGVEVDVKDFHHATVEKRYAMGRVAMELAYVMPDEKTVYISDDGTYTGLYMFKADKKGDLSSGKLYAAKWNQTSGEGAGSADLDWIPLGHARDAEIKAYIDEGITFDQIFEYDEPDSDGNCADGLTKIAAGHERKKVQCLAVKRGMKKVASRLETRRYAALMGGTTEWEKMEGITHDPDTNTMYLAMSRVRSGMSDGEGDIAVKYNYCGAVYALPLDRYYVATSMHGELSGIPRVVENGAAMDKLDEIHRKVVNGSTVITNGCDVDGISEPDNITLIPGYGTLIIGEDTGNNGHQNDVIWAYDLDSKELTRIQTTPYGSETTSPYFYPNINGFSYLMSVVQHPFGESDQDKLDRSVVPSEALGYTGYIGPMPALTKMHKRKDHGTYHRDDHDKHDGRDNKYHRDDEDKYDGGGKYERGR